MSISMTGFGRGSYEDDRRTITVECKSINHKYSDFSFRLPRKLSFLEEKCRAYIKNYINRGRVEVSIKLETKDSKDVRLVFDENLAEQYYNILKTIRAQFPSRDDISVMEIAKYPDVVKAEEADESEEELWNALESALSVAVKQMVDMRVLEGERMTKDILDRCKLLDDMIRGIESKADSFSICYMNKLNERIKELVEDMSNIDENRLAQEVAFIADKACIDEEIVRFKSHIAQLRATVVSHSSVGRKMDFIIQEMNRETNTIGSKSPDIRITNIVVDMKSEIEKIREQVQNIE